jgi:hypothetical protein
MGRVVFQEQENGYAGTTLTLDVASLPSGTYILRMTNGNVHEVAQVQLRN